MHIMTTCLVQLRIGDPIYYPSRDCILKIIDYQLTPNGINDPKLVCIITAEKEGYTVSATSDKFKIVDDQEYQTIYKRLETK